LSVFFLLLGKAIFDFDLPTVEETAAAAAAAAVALPEVNGGGMDDS